MGLRVPHHFSDVTVCAMKRVAATGAVYTLYHDYNLSGKFRKLCLSLRTVSNKSDAQIQRAILGDEARINEAKRPPLIACASQTLYRGLAAINLLREFSDVLEVERQLPKTETALLELCGKIYKILDTIGNPRFHNIDFREIPDEAMQRIANLIITETPVREKY